MLASLLNSLFGCSHQRTTFPLTPSRKMATTSHRHGHVRRVSRLRPRVSLRLEADARWRSRRAAPCYRHVTFSGESLSSRARGPRSVRCTTECARAFSFSKTFHRTLGLYNAPEYRWKAPAYQWRPYPRPCASDRSGPRSCAHALSVSRSPQITPIMHR